MIHYIVVRRDLPFGDTLAQVAHAAAESNDLAGHCTVAVLGVRNERRLRKLSTKLASYGITHTLVEEPDLDGEATALGVKPGSRDDLAPFFRNFQTYREFEGPESETRNESGDV